MNRKRIKKLLESKRQQLLVRRPLSEIQVDEVGSDWADQAARSLWIDQQIVSAKNGSKILFEVESALKRLKDKNGKFGICIDCGERISDNRLKALPWANTCILCANQSELPRPPHFSAFK